MVAPSTEAPFWLSLSRNGQRLDEELNSQRELSIPLFGCFVGGYEGDAFDLEVSKEGYPNGVHIYMRGKAKDSVHHLFEGLRDDMFNFHGADPRMYGRLESTWKFHLDDWVFGQTDLVWIWVIGLTETGAYDGRGHSKGYMLRSQPRRWQVVNADAFLNRLVSALRLDDTEEQQQAANTPPATAILSSAAAALSSTTTQPALVAQRSDAHSSTTVPFDPLAAARLAFHARPRVASSARPVPVSPPGVSSSSSSRGTKRDQSGRQRTTPFVRTKQSATLRALSRPPRQPSRVDAVLPSERPPPRPEQDRVVQRLPPEQLIGQSRNAGSRAIASSPSPRQTQPPPRSRVSDSLATGQSLSTRPCLGRAARTEPISDRRREKTRATEPQPRDPIVNRVLRPSPITVESGDSDSNHDADEWVAYDSDDSHDDAPLGITIRNEDRFHQEFAKTYDESHLIFPIRRSARIKNLIRSRSTSTEAELCDLEPCPYVISNDATALVDAFKKVKDQKMGANPQLWIDLRVDTSETTPARARALGIAPGLATDDEEAEAGPGKGTEEVSDDTIADWAKAIVGSGGKVGPLHVVPLQQRELSDLPPDWQLSRRLRLRIGESGARIAFSDCELQYRWHRLDNWRMIEQATVERDRERLEKQSARYLSRRRG